MWNVSFGKKKQRKNSLDPHLSGEALGENQNATGKPAERACQLLADTAASSRAFLDRAHGKIEEQVKNFKIGIGQQTSLTES